MSVPFRSKLSYAWARATHADRIYSRVFDDDLGRSEWVVAQRIGNEAERDTFKMYLCSYGESSDGGQRHYQKFLLHGLYASEEVIQKIKLQEKAMFAYSKPAREQPFQNLVKTTLPTPKV